MSERLNRKEMKHDKFVDEMEVAYGAMRRNMMRVIGAIVAAVVIVGAVVALYAYQNKKETEAQTLLGDAIDTMASPAGEADPANPTAAAPKFKTEKERDAAAEAKFKAVVAKYPGRDAADVANLYLAQMAAARGDAKTAEPMLRQFLGEHGDHILAGSAQLSLYQLQLGSGASQQVIAEAEKELSVEKPKLPKDVLLSVIARAYEQSGNDAKARDAWQRLINEYPDSPYTIDAQRKVAQG